MLKGKFDTNRFREGRFDDLAQGEQSWSIVYLQASICACRDNNTFEPDRKCPICSGYGYTWAAPAIPNQNATVSVTFYSASKTRPPKLPPHITLADIVSTVYDDGGSYTYTLADDGSIVFDTAPDPPTKFTITYNRTTGLARALLTTAMARKDWHEFGQLDHRDVVATFPSLVESDGTDSREVNPAWQISEYDQVVVLDMRIRKQDILIRGKNDRLTYGYVKEIERVHSVDRQSYAVTEYVETTDFNVSNGVVQWVGAEPPARSPYTVSYIASPIYYVWRDLAQVRQEGSKHLPPKVILRLFELYGKKNATYNP